MENFDDLMRQKYDNDDPAGRFEFREEYWEQARALIEADEARRRRGLWRWIFAGVFLLIAGAGWWWMASVNGSADGGRRTADGIQSIGISGAAQKNTHSSGVLQPTTTATNLGDSAAIESTGYSKLSEKGLENQPGHNQKNIPETTSQQQKPSSSNNRFGQNKSYGNSTGAIQPGLGMQPKGQESRFNDAGQLSHETVAKTQSAEASGMTNPIVIPPSAEIPGAGNQALLPPPIDNATKKLEQFLQQLFTLPLPFPPVISTGIRNIKTPVNVESSMAGQIKPAHGQRFAVGVQASVAAFERAPDQRWLGFSASAFGIYQLSRQWSASLGFGMRYQPGSWLDSTGVLYTESLRYSFGFESATSERRTAGLLFVEIPMAAAWHHGTFAVEAGVAPGRLLYALDRYKEMRETSLTSRKTVRNRLERGDTTPYGKSYGNIFAGVEWRFAPKVSLTLRGNYRFGAIVKRTAEDPAVKGGSNVELGLRLKLF